MDLDLDSSYRSATSANSTSVNTSSSKAVLAALRALQDKIRRLESERSQALDEATDLRQKIKTLDIEATHSKDRQNLANQKEMNVARHSYDVLHTEKTEIEFRMRKYEERFKQEHRSHEELQEKYRNTDKELQTAVYQLKDVLYQKDQLEVIVDNAQRREKDLAATLLVEQKRHESEVTELHKRIHTLKHEIEDIENGKLHNETKIKELDHFVSQLLEINSSLVAKLSGRKVKTKKLTTLKPYDTAHKTTVSSQGHRTIKYEARKASQLVSVDTEDLAQLKAMHRMYTNIAKNIIHQKEKKSKLSSSSMKLSKSMSSNRATFHSSVINTDTGSHKKERKTTRLSAKKEQRKAGASFVSLAGTEASSVSKKVPKSYSNSSSSSHSHSSSGYMDIRIPQPSTASASSMIDESRVSMNSPVEHDSYSYMPNKHFFNRPLSSPTTTNANMSALEAAVDSVENDIGTRKASRTIFNSAFGHIESTPSSSSSSSSFSSSSSNGGVYGKGNEDLSAVISSLENEFDSLNLQYRQLLSTVQSDTPSEAVQNQAEQIVDVIQKLHQKGEQLRALKSPVKNPHH